MEYTVFGGQKLKINFTADSRIFDNVYVIPLTEDVNSRITQIWNKYGTEKIMSFVVVLAIIAAGIVFIPKLMHTCDDCEKFFIGAGYEPNVVEDLLSSNEQIICKNCAEKQHAIAIAMGQSVDDFKRDLFE